MGLDLGLGRRNPLILLSYLDSSAIRLPSCGNLIENVRDGTVTSQELSFRLGPAGAGAPNCCLIQTEREPSRE